jgi:hypothetical protein
VHSDNQPAKHNSSKGAIAEVYTVVIRLAIVLVYTDIAQWTPHPHAHLDLPPNDLYK